MGNMMSLGGGHASAGDASAVDAYVSRLSDAEIKRYTDGYRRICRGEGSSSPAPSGGTNTRATFLHRASSSASNGSSSNLAAAATEAAANGPLLSKKLFRNKVLGAFTMVPHSLSDRLFEVLDTERSGELSLVNVLSGLAWLKHGTYEEQVQLLFIIYDLDAAGEVSREVLDRFMDVIYGRRRARHATTVKFLDGIFDGRAVLELHEFRTIVQEKDDRGDALLVKWLAVLAAKIGSEDDPQILALEKTYNPVAIRRRIAQATLFSLTEVTALERQFQKIFDPKGGASTRIPSSQFIEVLSGKGLFPDELLEKFCACTAMPELVLFEEFCQFLSDFCRGGSREEKALHLFKIYSDRSTTVRVDFAAMKDLIHVGVKCDSNDANEDAEQEEERQVEEISATQTAEAGWDEEAFARWADGAVAVQRLLHQLAFAACILFGLKPESAYLEKRIVEWHWREATRAFGIGQTWNLVGAEWWRKWCDYVSMDPKNGSPYGSLPVPLIPPNTVVEVARNIRGNIASRAASFSGDANSSRPPRPGPIANWDLLMQSGSRRLKQKLVLARDFYMIPSSVYAVMFSWYSGGPDLVRSIVEVPTKAKSELQIELLPLVLRVARVDPANGSVIRSGEEILLSELSTPAILLEATCRAMLLLKLVDKARLWYFNDKTPNHKIRLRDEYPNELKKLTQDSVFLLEVQDDDGSWPLSQTDDTITSSPSSNGIRQPIQGNGQVSESDDGGTAPRKRQREHRPSLRTSDICSRGNLGEALGQRGPGSDAGSPTIEVDPVLASPVVRKRFSKDAFKGPGLVGLDNLGNTCYMSSALQCLSHTRLLVEYFKDEAYLKDINLRNRDGTNGKLTASFGELLRVLWTSDRKRFAPNEFKKVLAKCNPQFAGSDQHDAQELLACLLSSLSEDLNRVVKKPYTEQPDSDGRPDALVAEEWWQNHQKREFSVIVALFTGQYKSLLECSICRYESARFEPFTFLQLSLPESNSRSIVVTIIFRTDRVPLRFSVRVQSGDMVKQMKEQVAAFLNKTQTEGAGSPMAADEAKSPAEPSTEGDWTKVVIARTSNLHTVETILDDKLPLTQIHEKDQLTAFQLDCDEDLLPPRLTPPKPSEPADASLADTNQKASAIGTSKNESTMGSSDARRLGNGEVAKRVLVNGITPGDAIAVDEDTPGDVQLTDKADLHDESDQDDEDEVLPLGTSVYVRIDKTKDIVAARVIGSSSNSGTVNVAYPSGVRRYHIPLSKVIERRQSDAFIFLVHRRVERSTDSFTNAHITRLFGAPLVIRVSLRVTTAYNLYLLVWNRLRRIFNWQQPPPPSDFDGKNQGHKRVRTDTSSMALGEHLSQTKFGFCLRLVTSHGIGCSRCEWLDGCLGCVLMPSSHTVIPLAAEETVAIDWDIRTLKEEYDPIQASKMDFDASVQQHQRQDNQPLNLAHCMEMFTAKETIPEAYCGHCKTLRPATKKMDLWRLPPLLVIHLKRFCFTQVSRRKLHHLVDFPLRGLQFGDFVARKREPRGRLSGLEYWLFLGGKLKADANNEKPEPSPTNGSSKQARPGSPRRVSSSALDAPAAATSAVRGDDGFLYDLYAVVNHVGALGGGHYFAYVLSDHDGKWKCFNDHQCKDIDEKEVVSSMAYILFYRRRDMANVSIEQLFPPLPVDVTGNGASTEEEAASDKAQVEELLQQSKLAASGNASNCIIS
ncbi:Ubiquitin carboxyl-terminal hydrolase 32 [Phytophthora pseudosyringae]|uniref:ubiquitinyl hydrolase 1 n=1 Tax=Phytophthora pseudosyringae TaxID=221518 RepID=A0A8T1VXD5_9STRA|nr:Ubiquitin carboxyl-terminal hydrolase 32 [Phytophthora pseudosyringae]